MAISAAIPNTDGSAIITFEYDPTGLAWCIMRDNPCVGWGVDPEALTPQAPNKPEPVAAIPIIAGEMPEAPPDTAPVLSPSWAQFVPAINGVFVPDTRSRGSLVDMFEFVASNNGADRKLWAEFASPQIAAEYSNWRARFPSHALDAKPAPQAKHSTEHRRHAPQTAAPPARRSGHADPATAR